MKLVFVTQVLDGGDAVLGFVARWVQGLAARCERVRVIALEAGDLSGLPSNVDVRVLGRKGRLRRYFRYQAFLADAFGTEGFDTLLTHMVPRYSTAAARSAARHGVGHYLWYTHKGVDARLRKAVTQVDKVFTASAESMRVETDKKVVTGHGIDLAHFGGGDVAPDQPPRLLAVGRLTPAKDPHTLLGALTLLRARGRDVHLDLVGGGLASGDSAFGNEVRARITDEGLDDCVVLHGAVPYRDVPAAYYRATVFVSTSLTGSVDKVVLEAMAAGRPVVTCNESFPPLFAELGGDAERLVFAKGDAEQLAGRIEWLLDLSDPLRADLGGRLRAIVSRDHEVDALMGRLVAEMGGSA